MLKAHQKRFDRYLAQKAPFVSNPASLNQPIAYYFKLGGKRVRPMLCLLSYELFRKKYENAFPQALAIEMFHNFSLIHDDIMDRAPLRRGEPAAHEKFGTEAAILSGDAMLVLAYQYLVEGLSQARIPFALRLFSKTALQICRGQQYDLDLTQSRSVDMQEYLKMIKLKTAVLLGTAMALGALRADAPKKTIRALRKCGVAMGVAFQLQDDLLDVFGDPAKTGKQRGGDILQNKKTYLLIKSYQLANDRTRHLLDALYGDLEINPEEKVHRVIDIYQSLGVEQHARRLINKYLDLGFSILSHIEVSDEKKVRLNSMFEFLSSRDK